jgi:hypothetical protein
LRRFMTREWWKRCGRITERRGMTEQRRRKRRGIRGNRGAIALQYDKKCRLSPLNLADN